MGGGDARPYRSHQREAELLMPWARLIMATRRFGRQCKRRLGSLRLRVGRTIRFDSQLGDLPY